MDNQQILLDPKEKYSEKKLKMQKLKSLEMDVERRKYIRFSLQDNIFAALGSEFEAVGKVTDISIKGLTLSYICESIKTGSDRDLSQVYIFLSSSSLHLPKVPCEIVYDIKVSESMKHNSIMIRQCGLRFGKLSKSQSEQLESLIENYAIESLSVSHYKRKVNSANLSSITGSI